MSKGINILAKLNKQMVQSGYCSNSVYDEICKWFIKFLQKVDEHQI